MPKRKKHNDDNNCSGGEEDEDEYIQPGSMGGGGLGKGKTKTGQQKGTGRSSNRGGQTSAAAAAASSQSMMPISNSSSSNSEIDPSSSSSSSLQQTSVLSSLGTSTFDDYSQSLSLKPDHVNRPLWISIGPIPFRPIPFGLTDSAHPIWAHRFGPSHLGPWVLLAYVGFLINLS